MKKTNFTFVNSEYGDWQGLYINGKLAAEGHNISARDVLDCIADILPHNIITIEVPQDIAEMGMPMYLDDFNT
jgi:hypothetical protein